jgi:hypothetical protein
MISSIHFSKPSFVIPLHLHCCQHIADNIQQRFGNKVRPLFRRAARVKDPRAFDIAMEAIQDENKEAFEYLRGISKRLWTRAFAPYPKWGHEASNIIDHLMDLGQKFGTYHSFNLWMLYILVQ